MTVPERRAGRTRGKSDPIDALAIARAAIREPNLSRPRPDERVYRELKPSSITVTIWSIKRRRTQQGGVGICTSSIRPYQVPLRKLDPRLAARARWLAGLRGANRSCRCGSHESSSSTIPAADRAIG